MTNKVGKLIKKARQGVSLRTFADLIGVSHTIIDTYEKGYDPRTKKPIRHTVDTLTKISVGARIPLDKLLIASVEDMSNIELRHELNIDMPKQKKPPLIDVKLTEEQQQLNTLFSQLNEEGQSKVIEYVTDLIGTQKYTQGNRTKMVQKQA